MQVLYLNHPESDYGGAMLYDGLCRVLGAENVVDYPCKWSYHGTVHTYTIPHIEHGVTAPLPWMPVWPPRIDEDKSSQRDRVLSLLRDKRFSCVIVESLRTESIRVLEELGSEIRQAGIPVVAYDGEDFGAIRWDLLKRLGVNLLLKRELYKSDRREPDFVTNEGIRILAFPFACALEAVEDVHALPNVRSDVVFICGRTDQIRQRMADALRDASWPLKVNVRLHPDDRNTGTHLLGWREYIGEMKAAKFAVSARGYGVDTVRFWECAACSVLVTQRLDLHIPHPFTDGVNCLEYSTPEEAIEKMIDAQEHLESLRNACYTHLKTHHTTTARAKYLLNALGLPTEVNYATA